jgi:DNA-binding transcriptional regulator YiaG
MQRVQATVGVEAVSRTICVEFGSALRGIRSLRRPMVASKKTAPPRSESGKLVAALFPRLAQRQRESEQRFTAASRRKDRPGVQREEALQLGPLWRDFHAAGALIERIRSRRLKPGDVALLRTALGLSQARFARALDISARTLQNWEQGRAAPDRGSLALLRIAARYPQIICELAEQPW